MDPLQRLRQGAWGASQPQSQADASRYPDRASPVARLSMAGLLPTSFFSGDRRNETEHNKGWTYLSLLKLAEQCAASSVNVYDASEAQKAVRRGWVTKGSGPDDQAGQQSKLSALPDHPIARLLKRPNPIDDQGQFIKRAVFQYGLTGGCVIWEVRSAAGRPTNLYVLPRAWLQYQRADERRPMGFYVVTATTGNVYGWGQWGFAPMRFELDIRSTIRFGDPHSLYPGEYYSRLTACDELIDICNATDKEVLSEMLNGIKPGLAFALRDGQQLTKDQFDQLIIELKARHAGPNNAGEVLILGGMEPVPLQPPPDGKVDSRNQNREFIQRIFGIPEVAFGSADSGTYSGNAAVMKAFTENTVSPITGMMASAFTHRWSPIHGDDFKVEIKPPAFDDPEMKLKAAGEIKDAVKSGGASWNEWRAAMDLPPKEGLDEIKEPAPPPMPGQPPGQPGDPAAGGADDDMDLGVDDLADDDAAVPGLDDPNRQDVPRQTPRFSFSKNGSH